MTWTEEMDEEYAKAVEYYEDIYNEKLADYEKELKEKLGLRLRRIRQDIEAGIIL